MSIFEGFFPNYWLAKNSSSTTHKSFPAFSEFRSPLGDFLALFVEEIHADSQRNLPGFQ